MKNALKKASYVGAALAAAVILAAASAPAAGAADSPLTLSPTEFNFGTINIGGESTWQGEFTVTNESDQNVNLQPATFANPQPHNFLILRDFCAYESLHPAQSCLLILAFDPKVEGDLTDELVINSDAPGTPPTSTVTGKALPRLLPELEITPPDADFGTVPVGSESVVKTFKVKDTGLGDLDLGSITVAGPERNEFSIVDESCSNITMASGSFCEIKAKFTPVDAGPSEAYISVPVNASGGRGWIDLKGTGMKPVETPPGSSATLLAGKVTWWKGRLRVPALCSVKNTTICSGELLAATNGKSGWKTVGSRKFTLGEGKATRTLKLNSSARRTFKKTGKLKVRLLFKTAQPGGTWITAMVVVTVRR